MHAFLLGEVLWLGKDDRPWDTGAVSFQQLCSLWTWLEFVSGFRECMPPKVMYEYRGEVTLGSIGGAVGVAVSGGWCRCHRYSRLQVKGGARVA
jgi:hypothetical protein